MSDMVQIQLVTAGTTDVTHPAKRLRNSTMVSAYAKATGGTSASIQFEASADPMGLGGFAPVAVRQSGGGAYAVTAVSITPAAPKSFYFDPADAFVYLRVIVSAQSGPTSIDVWANSEV